MGSQRFVTRTLHMGVGIGPGTDCLGHQRFPGIGGRHLAGHHTVKVFLQRKFIDQHNPLLRPQQFQTAPVCRYALTAVDALQNDLAGPGRGGHHQPGSPPGSQFCALPRLHIRSLTRPNSGDIAQIGIRKRDFQTLPGRITHDRILELAGVQHLYGIIRVTGQFHPLVINPLIITIFQQHPDVLHGVLPGQQYGTDLPFLQTEIRKIIADAKISVGDRRQFPVQPVSLHIPGKFQSALAFQPHAILIRRQHFAADFPGLYPDRCNQAIRQFQVRYLFPQPQKPGIRTPVRISRTDLSVCTPFFCITARRIRHLQQPLFPLYVTQKPFPTGLHDPDIM